MVGEAEESVSLGSMDQLFRYLIDAGFEIVEGDAGYGAGGVFWICHCLRMECEGSLSDGGISNEELKRGGRVMVCLLRYLQRDAEGIYFSV